MQGGLNHLEAEVEAEESAEMAKQCVANLLCLFVYGLTTSTVLLIVFRCEPARRFGCFPSAPARPPAESLLFVCLFVSLFVCLFVCFFVCLFVCLCVSCVCLFVC